MRRTLVALLVTAGALTVAAPASAGVMRTQNSCKVSFDQVWHHATVDLSGLASPNPAAPGSGTTLGQTSARVILPEYLTRVATDAMIFKAGENEVRVKAWLAIEGPGTPQRVVVHPIETVAHTTVTTDADGHYVSSTPLDVTVALPDSAWTAGSAAIGFRQGGANVLPPVPAGVGGASVQPLGSLLIRAEIAASGVGILLDCQPAVGEGQADPAFFTASAFETVAIDPGAAPVPAPRAVPSVALHTTKLKAKGRRIKVALSCTAADCQGALTVKAGSRSLVPRTKYAIRSGARKTITLRLSKAAQRSLKRKKSLRVTVRVTATGGKTITKKLRLR